MCEWSLVDYSTSLRSMAQLDRLEGGGDIKGDRLVSVCMRVQGGVSGADSSIPFLF